MAAPPAIGKAKRSSLARNQPDPEGSMEPRRADPESFPCFYCPRPNVQALQEHRKPSSLLAPSLLSASSPPDTDRPPPWQTLLLLFNSVSIHPAGSQGPTHSLSPAIDAYSGSRSLNDAFYQTPSSRSVMSGSGTSPRPQGDAGDAQNDSINAQTQTGQVRAPRTEQELAQVRAFIYFPASSSCRLTSMMAADHVLPSPPLPPGALPKSMTASS